MSESAGGVLFARVTDAVLKLADCSNAVSESDAGAVVTFSGIVRDHDNGRSVSTLDYEAHPSAGTVISAVAASVIAEFPGVRIAIEHRVGHLAVGDLALAAAVASAHRSEAFTACARLIDEVKRLVPIWKEQHFVDGTSEWIGSL